LKLGVVIQRYGGSVSGGAEEHARRLSEHLANNHSVEVLTTCANNYDTWENVFPRGVETIAGVTVRRFPTDFTREKISFDQLTETLLGREHSYLEEMEWLVHQGPYSEGLFRHLEQHRNDFDIIIFYTYLYVTTVIGLSIAPERSILVSTAHDEPVIRFSVFRNVFHLPRGIVYLAEEERDFVTGMFQNHEKPSEVIGLGFDPFSGGDAGRFRAKYGISGAILLYVGRVDEGKGCKIMVDHFLRFLEEEKTSDLNLVMMGTRHMHEVNHPRVFMTGFATDDEKQDALAAATVVVSPSRYESLSILVLEAFNASKPVLANSRSEVVKGHCLRSGGGLTYSDYGEFRDLLVRLLRQAELRETIGRKGLAYIDAGFRWAGVLERFDSLLRKVAGENDKMGT
jgi:glycosyltransferase involved in cell wall biosynthesis